VKPTSIDDVTRTALILCDCNVYPSVTVTSSHDASERVVAIHNNDGSVNLDQGVTLAVTL
jgi:hypothetical protein